MRSTSLHHRSSKLSSTFLTQRYVSFFVVANSPHFTVLTLHVLISSCFYLQAPTQRLAMLRSLIAAKHTKAARRQHVDRAMNETPSALRARLARVNATLQQRKNELAREANEAVATERALLQSAVQRAVSFSLLSSTVGVQRTQVSTRNFRNSPLTFNYIRAGLRRRLQS